MSLSRAIAHHIVAEKTTIPEVLDLLKKYRLTALLPSIKQSVEKLAATTAKRETIIIETPFPVSDDSVKKIKRIVGNDLAKHEVVLNQDLLAGFRATFKGTLYDGSANRIIKQLLAK